MTLDADPVAATLERVRKQSNLVLSENQAAALLLVTIILLDRLEMLMTLLTDQRCRLAIPQFRVGQIDREIAQLRVLDEGRIRIPGDQCTGIGKRIVALDTIYVIHPAVPIDSSACPICPDTLAHRL